MKKIFTLLICILLLTAVIPLTVFRGRKREIKQSNNISVATADEVKHNTLTDDELDYIACNVMLYTENDADTQTKKALLALCINNYIYKSENNIPQDELNISKYSDDFLTELKKLSQEIDITLLHNNKTVYIPIVKSSAGYTKTDDKYPYLQSVASPWDVFCNEYNADEYEAGISVTGIKYLCESGSTYKEALKWYLPDFELHKK